MAASGPNAAASSGAAEAPSTTLTATARDLGTLGGRGSEATAIQGNLVIGRAQTTDGSYHAFVYDLAAASPRMRDLGVLSGDTDSVATALSGHIVVGGSSSDLESNRPLKRPPNTRSPMT
jgi:probable HAF family extracellular repeat protein